MVNKMSADEITIEQLMIMKRLAAERNNWKEVERINKMIRFRMPDYRRGNKGRKPMILRKK
ncbi:MAG: hypothetical protein GXN99_00650 [Candidatus Nanohaloarchaeota archaeon]|nr:hypothetical protein [Candidatus Nanohaloarchaeota archaeon]